MDINKSIEDISKMGESGEFFFEWLMNRCGFLKPYNGDHSVYNCKNIDVFLTHNDALRSLYLRIRSHMPEELIKKVEIDRKFESMNTEHKIKDGEEEWMTKF